MKLLTAADIAKLLQLNAAHVRDRLSKRRDFPPATRLGKSLRWQESEILDWIEARRVSPIARQRKPQQRAAA